MGAAIGGSGTPQRQVVLVGGRRLALTSLDKVMYPSTGFTKADVLAYYQAVAPALLRLAAERPATRKRWVHGVGTADEPGQVFFVKNLEQGAPDWVRSVELEHKAHRIRYPLINDLATLTWVAQMGGLELHVPQWRAKPTGSDLAERCDPDRLVLDLDPGEGVGLLEAAEVARLARRILKGMGLEPLPVTSGSKGIHLYAALDGSRSSDDVSAVAHELARALEADHPDLVVSDMKKALRRGKVLVDWSQNSSAKTTIVPYSLRGTLRPMAAAPRTWEELDSPSLAQLEPHEVVERLQRDGDLLAALTPDEPRGDALAQYRSMRDAGRTPEPGVLAAWAHGASSAGESDAPRSGVAAVPVGRVLAAGPDAPRSGVVAVPAGGPEAVADGSGNSFVIQEHHARRLHWDLRLERDGVLVSWALPRGVPAVRERNHLAVHTEDHPLEYGSFEGEIPHGEYGGGGVSIWDSGTVTLEKWRDDEVIAVLHGRRGGGLGGEPARIALIRTGRGRSTEGSGPYGEQWLIHRMALEPKRREPAAGPASDAPMRPEAMLAAVVPDGGPDPDATWSLEMKWDGIRALAVLEGGAVRLVSRNDLDLTPAYPELGVLPEAVDARSAVLDGEIVALDERGRPSFSLLQQRSGLTRPGEVERARRRVAVRYLLFDVLAVDGRSLFETPYHERRAVLERIVRARDGIAVPPTVGEATGAGLADAVATALAVSGELGLEGVVAKRVDSRYTPGRRSTDWLKLKHERAQEVVVGGWRPGNGRRAGGVGSLLLGIPTPEGLEYIGRVGTGFSDRELLEAGRRLRALASAESPFREVPRPDARDAHWVAPELVGEVRFAEWTHGGHLRQPSWRGWRPDKRPAEVVREA